jgi:hypothetical protein
MRDEDVSEIKETLAALKKEEARLSDIRRGQKQRGRLSHVQREAQGQRAQLSDFFASEDKAFRTGLSSRLKAHDLLATGGILGPPTYTRLETPFLIWGFRQGVTSPILDDTHIEPLNSWVKFRTRWQHEDGDIGPHDEVAFYFLWQNETGTDAVVNVESLLMLKGTCSLYAESGLFPWFGRLVVGEALFGQSSVSIDAELKLLEMWNQPATRPLRQPGQFVEVQRLLVEGGFTLAQWGATLGGQSWPLSGSHHVHYDGFRIPADAVAVFEVSLHMSYGSSGGWCEVDFHDPAESALVCPYVELEGLTAPLTVSG